VLPGFTGGKTGETGKAIKKALNKGYEESGELRKRLADWCAERFENVTVKAKTEFVRFRADGPNRPKIATKPAKPTRAERKPPAFFEGARQRDPKGRTAKDKVWDYILLHDDDELARASIQDVRKACGLFPPPKGPKDSTLRTWLTGRKVIPRALRDRAKEDKRFAPYFTNGVYTGKASRAPAGKPVSKPLRKVSGGKRTRSVDLRPSQAQQDQLEDAYPRRTREQQQEIIPHHNRLSNRFRKWLATAGAVQILAESNSVDVSCEHRNQSCLFELKTCHKQSARLALREALGQILEYAFYPGRRGHKCLAIVLDAQPTEAEIEWLRRLPSIGLTVELFWSKGEEFYSPRLSDQSLALHAREP
jgi:hypothetical protein